MADATLVGTGELVTITAENNIAKGDLIQVPGGRAGYADNAITAGDRGQVRVTGLAKITKNTGVVLLNGDEVFWDHSANEGTYKEVNDRDFFAGTVVGSDTTLTESTVEIALNERAQWFIDMARDFFDTVYVGTQGLNTMGIFRRGGGHKFLLSSTNEAQKMDMLSVAGFAPGANAIIDIVFTVPSNGGGTNTDVSLGVADGTHASDADAIAQSVLIHLNADTDLNIYCESDDGTNETAATDSLSDYTEGGAVANRVYGKIDMRDLSSVKFYINGVRVLAGTTFNMSAASGTLKLLAHIEKASSADTYEFNLESMRCRISEM